MLPLGDIKVLIGALLVMLIAAARFNTAPPARPPVAEKTSWALGFLKEAFQFKPEPASLSFLHRARRQRSLNSNSIAWPMRLPALPFTWRCTRSRAWLRMSTSSSV